MAPSSVHFQPQLTLITFFQILFTEESKEAYDNLVQNCKKELNDCKFPAADQFQEEVLKRRRNQPEELLPDIQIEENSNRINIFSSNAVPLPPKPQAKPPITCTKRHVRKHPLIITKTDTLNETTNSLNSKIEYENIECNLAVLNDQVSLIKF